MILIALDWSSVSGIHSGIIGLAVNLTICFLGIVKKAEPFNEINKKQKSIKHDLEKV